MEATQMNAQIGPGSGSLRELEVPMINTMVMCLGSEHRKLHGLVTRFGFSRDEKRR